MGGGGGAGAFATSAFFRQPAGSAQPRRTTIASCFDMRGLIFTMTLRRERGPNRASRDHFRPDALSADPPSRLSAVISPDSLETPEYRRDIGLAPGFPPSEGYFTSKPSAFSCSAVIVMTSICSGIGVSGLFVESFGSDTIFSTTSIPLNT